MEGIVGRRGCKPGVVIGDEPGAMQEMDFRELRHGGVPSIHLPRASELWSELHTIRGRKRKLRIFEPSRGLDTPLTRSLKNPRFLCRPRVTILPSLQSRLKRLCGRGADSRRPKGPSIRDNGSNRLLYTSRSARAGFLYQTGA